MDEHDSKTCARCGKPKPFSEFRRETRKGKGCRFGLRSPCKDCMNLIAAKYREENRGKLRAYHKKYREENRGEIRASAKKHIDKNPEYFAQYYGLNREAMIGYQKKYRDRECEILGDSYIAKQLAKGTNLTAKVIPQELIALKRAQLQLARQLKR